MIVAKWCIRLFSHLFLKEPVKFVLPGTVLILFESNFQCTISIFLMCFTLSMDDDPGICWEPALSCCSPKQNHKEILWFVNRYPFTADQKIAEPDWQVYLRDTAKTILLEQSPAKLMTVRTRLYELLVHGIPINIVFKVSW